MKKIITISIIFTLILSVAIWEITYSTRLYTDIYSNLELLEQSIEASGEQINNAQTLEILDRVVNKWNKGKEVLFCFGNHTVLRGVDEKLISLDKMVKINYKDDALVTVSVSKSLIKGILNDTHPVPTNLM